MKYTTKRLLRGIAYSAQSARWMTQEPVLKQLWRGKITPSGNYLDVGCGGGSYGIEFFLRANAKATLVEYDPALRQLAENQVAQVGYQTAATILPGNAEELNLPISTFDGVQCIEVLEHLRNPGAALRGMRVATKLGGWLLTSVPHPPEWIPNADHVTAGFTGEEFSKLIEASGWKVIEVRYCMLFLFRCFAWLASRGLKPHGLNWLLLSERLIPNSLRMRFLPYDVVILAKAI